MPIFWTFAMCHAFFFISSVQGSTCFIQTYHVWKVYRQDGKLIHNKKILIYITQAPWKVRKINWKSSRKDEKIIFNMWQKKSCYMSLHVYLLVIICRTKCHGQRFNLYKLLTSESEKQLMHMHERGKAVTAKSTLLAQRSRFAGASEDKRARNEY